MSRVWIKRIFGTLLCLIYVRSHFTDALHTEEELPLHCTNTARLLIITRECSRTGVSDFAWMNDRNTLPIRLDPDTFPFAPWTHQPACTKFLESINSELCVFTNSTFSNGRGISIFTTPKIAAEFAKLPALLDASALGATNSNHGPWYTEQMPNKGVGMLASVELLRGDRITAYTPALIVHRDQDLTTQQREQYLKTAVDQLPLSTKTMFFNLSKIYGNPDFIVQDVIEANTFEIQIGGEMHLAIFPETSRMNHDCGPNAQYFLDPDRLTHYVHAVRRIGKGEEITISYTNPLQHTYERRTQLSNSFRFLCSCHRCSSEQSDAILTEILDIQSDLSMWSSAKSSWISKVARLLHLLETDGLEGFMDVGYGYGVLIASALGQSEEAMIYAKLASEAVALRSGRNAPDFTMWDQIRDDNSLKRHWSWEWYKT